MAQQMPAPSAVDRVQIFDSFEPFRRSSQLPDISDMASSPNCDIQVFRTAPHGELVIENTDSDQIVFILQGQWTADGVPEQGVSKSNQGVLVPAGLHCSITNVGGDDLIVVSFRIRAGEERRLDNRPSDVRIRIPLHELNGKGFGGKSHLFFYALSRHILGVSSTTHVDEWYPLSLGRMHCDFEQEGDDIVAVIPERMARWYGLHGLKESDYKVLTDPDRTKVRLDFTPLVGREVGA